MERSLTFLTTDEYGEVTNSEGTYLELASALSIGAPVVVGWTDGEGTHYDVLLVLHPRQCGPLQGGVSGPRDLFVGIMRRGCFGFDASNVDTYPSYLAEKLGLAEYSESSTVAKLTDLINGVRKAMLS